MIKHFKINSSQNSLTPLIKSAILNFDNHTEVLGQGDRNVIKVITIEGKAYTIKSFKIPNLINQIVYRFFRKSKAERSFLYANKLIEAGIKTPFPVAFQNNMSSLFFKDSYYVSELLNCDLTYRELVRQSDYPDHENILRAFTRFTFDLHEKGILFLDHSPGNTLIVKQNDHYDFYLVDLNRMEFGSLDLETRIQNFARLTPKKDMVSIMANEYAKLTKKDETVIFDKMWKVTEEFQQKFHKKRALKRKLFFWKKKYREEVQ